MSRDIESELRLRADRGAERGPEQVWASVRREVTTGSAHTDIRRRPKWVLPALSGAAVLTVVIVPWAIQQRDPGMAAGPQALHSTTSTPTTSAGTGAATEPTRNQVVCPTMTLGKTVSQVLSLACGDGAKIIDALPVQVNERLCVDATYRTDRFSEIRSERVCEGKMSVDGLQIRDGLRAP